ncbi:MAG: lipid IV(A) 3-deoxy-D-manno-octulosonic acid transferase [Gammaproteobacteria bacterium]|nr:lipid IV(A) 3-deoxy-D-manno-octulosonic acid transferase [Gammaproteobacteria bacterium]MDH5304428.1 lipid IV(A) 3-deoxy-D-manno-octulosonic acid transferase [Gammaproteobacteria bacterium]MDH5322222.1 lipid IV(A) 3-deoxy-D-manno-octulosonic acid transferase [Gammaproteobacteria bacterium]
MQILYSLLTYLLQIPVAAYWLIRAIANRSYRRGMGQRFGFGYPKMQRCIWIHAVSVGEVQAAVPLIRELRRRFASHRLLVTTVTPTGAARVKALFGDSVEHAYIPSELPPAVDRFFASTNPKLALIMETEIWPNLYRGCGVREIPLILVSARISPKSLRGYSRMLPLFRETLSHGIIIAAQSKADAERFRTLGASAIRTWVIGNIKFDIELGETLASDGHQLRKQLFGDRPVWIAASTHADEEQYVLDAHASLRNRFPELLLVLVPRHPERFRDVAKLVEQHGFACVTRTSGESCGAATPVYLLDTMGELPLFYAASDVAFVGGSLVPIGGHNLLEPAALGVPVISGPHVFNAQEIADMFIDTGACRLVTSTQELVAAVQNLISDPEAARFAGDQGRKIVMQNRGSLGQLLKLLEPLIGASQGGRRPS